MGGKGGVEGNINDGIDVTNTFDVTLSVPDPIETRIVVPEPIRTESSSEFAITQPIVMQNSMALDIQPLRTELAVTEPIVTESASNIALDVRPMVVDLCFKVEFGDFPATCIRQPYQHHFGITLFGVELLGFNFVGESQTIIDSIPKRPQIAGGTQQRTASHSASRAASSQGLHIRLGD
jgi:hypothetical protein